MEHYLGTSTELNQGGMRSDLVRKVYTQQAQAFFDSATPNHRARSPLLELMLCEANSTCVNTDDDKPGPQTQLLLRLETLLHTHAVKNSPK